MLNVLEMWMCLVFRTLPAQLLEEWLPDDPSVSKERKEGKEGVFGGLNIACPLDNGVRERDWIDLSDSDDPLVREYLGIDRLREEERTRSVARAKKTEDTPQMRNKIYIEHAQRFNEAARNEIKVPRWVVFSTIAAMIGVVMLSHRGAVQPRGRWG